MFAKERQEEILKLLKKDGKVLVKDLSDRFSVSEDCIRKDLKVLDERGVLERTYGGGVIARKQPDIPKVKIRKYFNVEAKLTIAKKALDLIEDGDIVFLDISTTNVLLAELLNESNKKITVVTNMIDILPILNDSTNNIKVICTGGVLNKEISGFSDAIALENMSKYKIHKAFIGSCGVNLFDKSITTISIEDSYAKKAIIESSKKVFLVMENSKFYYDGSFKFADLYNINAIITESTPNEEITKLIKELPIDIY